MWISEGIYRIEISAFQKMINSISELFSPGFSDLIISNNYYNVLFLFLFCFFPILLFFVRQKQSKVFLMSVCIMVAGFLPSVFFYGGTWNDISASRYAYLPTLGAAIFVANLFVLIYSIKYVKFILVPLYFVVALYFLNFNYLAVEASHSSYEKIDKQSRGMLASFEEHKEEIARKNKVVLVQAYPFYGNNYYIYMYNLLVDKNFEGEWLKELDWDKAFAEHSDSSVLLVWDDKLNIFYVANDKNNKHVDPSLRHRVNEKRSLKFMRENAIGITGEELNKIPIGLDNMYGIDTDGDGITDDMEDVLGTKIDDVDSDQDGYEDYLEIQNNYPAIIAEGEKTTLDKDISDKYLNKVVLEVEKNGEAWYINPDDGKRYFLGAPDKAFLQLYYLGVLK